MAIILDENLTADGETEGAKIYNPNNGTNIYQVVYASGTFGGGTLTIQISNDGGTTWFAATNSVGNVTFTGDGADRLFLLAGDVRNNDKQIKVRGSLSGATSPDINVTIADVR